MKITLLTSSRADLGIQVPLIQAIVADPNFQLTIIAFGSHLDARFGMTISEVRAAFKGTILELPPVLVGDSPADISLAMAWTMEQFAVVWRDHPTDMVIALGDRYEMFAAVAAALPFGIPVAHLHGGETTMGAIDNAFRHSISHMAQIHFTCAEPYRKRVEQLLGDARNIHNTGALSMDNLRKLELMSVAELLEKFGIDLSNPTVLITFHPETADHSHLGEQWVEFRKALHVLAQRYRLLITLPNADTGGLKLRARWMDFLADEPNATGVDSLGALGYLSCMKHAAFLLGNSSSGYVEASFFPKHVIDVGERQKGRIVTPNIERCAIRAVDILATEEKIRKSKIPEFEPPYGNGRSALLMIQLLKDFS